MIPVEKTSPSEEKVLGTIALLHKLVQGVTVYRERHVREEEDRRVLKAMGDLLDLASEQESVLVALQAHIEDLQDELCMLEPYNGAGSTMMFRLVSRVVLALQGDKKDVATLAHLVKMC